MGVVVTAERVGITYLSSKEDRTLRSAKRQQSLPESVPFPETSQDTDLDGETEKPRPMKKL
jgi:hypothetical protein